MHILFAVALGVVAVGRPGRGGFGRGLLTFAAFLLAAKLGLDHAVGLLFAPMH